MYSFFFFRRLCFTNKKKEEQQDKKKKTLTAYKSKVDAMSAKNKKPLQPSILKPIEKLFSYFNDVEKQNGEVTDDKLEQSLLLPFHFPSIVNNPTGIKINRAKRKQLRWVCFLLASFMQLGYYATYLPAYYRSWRPATPTISLLLDEDKTMTIVGLLLHSTALPFATLFVSLFTSSVMIPPPSQQENMSIKEKQRVTWIRHELNKMKGKFCFPLWLGFFSFIVFVVCVQLIFVVSVSKNHQAHYIVTLILTIAGSWFHSSMATKRWYKFSAFEVLFSSDNPETTYNHWIETFGFRRWQPLMFLNWLNIFVLWGCGAFFFLGLMAGYQTESFTHLAVLEYIYFHACFFLFYFFVLDIYKTADD
jgi:hypothetical protein